jgi:hypothetical protein
MDKVGLEFFILVAVYLSLSFLQSNLGIIEFNFSICAIFQNANFCFCSFFFFTKHFFQTNKVIHMFVFCIYILYESY